MRTRHMGDATRTIDKMIDQHEQAIDQLKGLRRAVTSETQRVVDDKATGIQLNKMELRILKGLYHRAIDEGRDRLEFKGHVLLTDYAGYVIEYLSSQFDDARR